MRVLKKMFCGVKHLGDGGYSVDIIREVKQKFSYAIEVVLRTDKSEGI